MRNLGIIVILLSFLISCGPEVQETEVWNFKKTVNLGSISAIGIVEDGEGGFWISDGDHNRIVQVDSTGKELSAFEDLERPMHIDIDEGVVYFPEYMSDSIKTISNGVLGSIVVSDSLDAPAGVFKKGDELAIADFYSHQVYYYSGSERLKLGGEGSEKGQFYYPTDVQLTEDRIWVADAYNNRVQVFDKDGAFMDAIGELDDINAATGLFISTDRLFVTDFENSRILVFDLEGNLWSEITEGIDKPTDMILQGNNLVVANYKGKSLSFYELEK